MHPVHFIYSKTIALLFPHRCAGCGKEKSVLCASCQAAIRPRSPACFVCNARNLTASVCPPCRAKTEFTHFYAPFSYAGVMPRELVHRLKYRFVGECGEIMGRRIAEGIRYYGISLPKNAVVAPVPLHPSKKIVRGFNQAELIAESLAKTFGAPLVAHSVLLRVKKTKPQVSFKKGEERAQNVADAFSVLDATPIFKKNVILIDDVATTGATLNEAAKALKRGGAKSVWALTFAK